MRSLRITFFITAAILLSMFLASIKVQAQVEYQACDRSGNSLYVDIQIFHQTHKISEQHAQISSQLENEISKIKIENISLTEKIHLIETRYARCDVQLSEQESLKIEIAKEALLKMLNPIE